MTHDDKRRDYDDTGDERRDSQNAGGDPSAKGAQVPPGKWSDGGDPSAKGAQVPPGKWSGEGDASAKGAQVPPGKWSEGSQGGSGEQGNRTDTTSPNDNESENAGVRPPLDHERVVKALREQGWNDVAIVESTGSTNTDLHAAASTLPDLSVLIAEEQVSGRGRLGRAWSAPRHSQVTLSVLLRPEVPPTKLGLLPLLTGVAVADTVRSYGIDARVKWPNDILVRGDKMCGILAEAVSMSDNPTVVVGFGLNIDLTKAELPIDNATSFALEGKHVDRTEVTIAVLGSLLERQRQWRNAGGSASSFIDDYKSVSATLNESVSAGLPNGGKLTGTAVDISDAGELLIRDARGQIHTVAAGDITHLRYS
ncbi:biotin--[acetyl-CoA-carboxylase] ligase [Corynebacterium kroppenstedtii]|uniref:biotin--[biotin carboxyl-carrier protein] ligase n=1 Tax=Corynebacterium kroppenstedtii (strain DSM 44385 / JCM 11950 / CIP 105744 / CCUG 35717) TaxID=645127 RepID=C4LKA2_CORK4|nr:biotin--[acetyl-CoA-carboxylase] ligase [Corynebacterium kroppenstedtii]ACR18257.1 biotin-protein ligase [Corynebacterium kroppenstedtii DSM 44385]QRP10390.1 biotin--[acetyl-CoA-carboxylase] ligase [Corynebacterium kroppenstedtii]HJD69573.1 biotin--[acetyl-CoA-carboxylase] ligase [Corynebacterium kroppenstedtii]